MKKKLSYVERNDERIRKRMWKWEEKSLKVERIERYDMEEREDCRKKK